MIGEITRSLDGNEHVFDTVGMDPLTPWQHLTVPRVDPAHWTVGAARSALREITRLRAGLDAAQAGLILVVKAEAGRDTRAALVRETGMSSAEARQAERVSEVAERVAGASAALADGQVSAAHLAALAPVGDGAAAAELLLHAAGGECVDDFSHRVRRHQIETDGAGVAERQRRARTLSFFRGDDGGIGLRALFTAVDGARVRAAIERACDAAWRSAHPDRADELGGHEGEPRDRRLSDALGGLVCGGVLGSVGPATPSTVPPGVEAAPGERSLPDGSRVGVVVILEEARMEAHLAGGDPIGLGEVAALVHDARTDLYAAVRSMSGAILRFGRSRRFASALQKLALIAREGGTCSSPGCTVPWNRCDVDHRVEWADGGPTDLDNLGFQCRNGHHAHRHGRDRAGAAGRASSRAGPGEAAA
jgi:hypothetical protein